LGTLEDANKLGIWDSYGGGGLQGALYVSNLVLDANSLFLIGSNTWVFFVNSNIAANATIGFANYDNNAPLIGAVPEPNVILLWLAGAGTAYSYRRRRRSRQAAKHGLANDRQVVVPTTNLDSELDAPAVTASSPHRHQRVRRRRRSQRYFC